MAVLESPPFRSSWGEWVASIISLPLVKDLGTKTNASRFQWTPRRSFSSSSVVRVRRHQALPVTCLVCTLVALRDKDAWCRRKFESRKAAWEPGSPYLTPSYCKPLPQSWADGQPMRAMIAVPSALIDKAKYAMELSRPALVAHFPSQ